MTDWKTPSEKPMTADAAVRWWLREHFQAAVADEVGIPALTLFASYCDAAVKVGLPVFSAVMFGRLLGSMVPKMRGYDSAVKGYRTAYQLRVKAGVELPGDWDVRKDDPNTGRIMRRLYLDARRASGAKDFSWVEIGASRDMDAKVLLRFLLDKVERQPTTPEGRSLAGIDAPVDEGRFEAVAVIDLWKRFGASDSGWSYIHFMDVLSRVAVVTRTATKKVCYLERK